MNIQVELTQAECASCGIPFAMPTSLEESLRKSGGTFFCPNGHNLTYGDGENEELKKQVKYQGSSIRNQYEQIERQGKSISNRDGQITKLRNKLSKEKK